MKKLPIILLFLFFIQPNIYAQKPAQAIYVELGGPGLVSFNFDTRFQKKEDGLGARIGFGGFSVENDNTTNGIYNGTSTNSSVFLIPAGLNYILGKDNKHYFEVGGGVTAVIDDNNAKNEGSDFTNTFGFLSFGYRMQPKEGGYFFRAAVTPVFGKGFYVPYLVGISFGYKF